jgi:hypothetical protein
MNPMISAGVLIGVACAVWTFVMGLTGWYADPVLNSAFFLVIPIEVAGLWWGLKKTAREGRTYGSQIVAGTIMAVIAGVIIIGSSLLFTTVAFPAYFDELQAMQRQMLAAQGKAPDQIEAELQAAAAMSTPLAQALAGFAGTLITGIVASALIATRVRAEAPRRRVERV